MTAATIALVGDLEEARQLHQLAFRGDPWPGDEHTFYAARVAGTLAGGWAGAFLSLTPKLGAWTNTTR